MWALGPSEQTLNIKISTPKLSEAPTYGGLFQPCTLIPLTLDPERLPTKPLQNP